MVTATATRVQQIQGADESKASSSNALGYFQEVLRVEIEALLQANESHHRAMAKRRRVDSAFDQVASYW